MDGGTCEASVFCNYEYAATGVCVVLGNYHNVDSRRTSGRQRITPEYVDVRDLDGLVRWFVALAAARREHLEGNPRLRTILTRLERRWTPLLNRTAARIPLPNNQPPLAIAPARSTAPPAHLPAHR